MPTSPEPQWYEVKARIVTGPDGEPGVLIQLPEGYVIVKRPEQVREIGRGLLELADILEERIKPKATYRREPGRWRMKIRRVSE